MVKKIGDRESKYLVTNLTERQKRIVQLKANLSSTSLDEFVVGAINAFSVHIKDEKCSACDTVLSINTEPYDFKTVWNDKEINIKILNYPRVKCIKCEEEFLSVRVDAILDKLIFFEILDNLKGRKGIPTTIDLNKLMEM